MKQLALLSAFLALPILAQVPAPTPSASAALPTHIAIAGITYNPNNHPNGSALFGVGQKVNDTDYVTNVTEFSPSLKGTLTANRTGLQHIIYAGGTFYAFATTDAGVAVNAQNTGFSWSGGVGIAKKLTAAHNVYTYGHVRFLDSTISVDRKAVVGSIGFVFGGQ